MTTEETATTQNYTDTINGARLLASNIRGSRFVGGATTIPGFVAPGGVFGGYGLNRFGTQVVGAPTVLNGGFGYVGGAQTFLQAPQVLTAPTVLANSHLSQQVVVQQPQVLETVVQQPQVQYQVVEQPRVQYVEQPVQYVQQVALPPPPPPQPVVNVIEAPLPAPPPQIMMPEVVVPEVPIPPTQPVVTHSPVARVNAQVGTVVQQGHVPDTLNIRSSRVFVDHVVGGQDTGVVVNPNPLTASPTTVAQPAVVTDQVPVEPVVTAPRVVMQPTMPMVWQTNQQGVYPFGWNRTIPTVVQGTTTAPVFTTQEVETTGDNFATVNNAVVAEQLERSRLLTGQLAQQRVALGGFGFGGVYNQGFRFGGWNRGAFPYGGLGGVAYAPTTTTLVDTAGANTFATTEGTTTVQAPTPVVTGAWNTTPGSYVPTQAVFTGPGQFQPRRPQLKIIGNDWRPPVPVYTAPLAGVGLAPVQVTE